MSTAQTLPTVFSGSSSTWEGSLYAFLAEKQRRSGSLRTPDSYYRTLRHFFGSLQKAPDQVSSSETYSASPMASASPGREPSPSNRRRSPLLHLVLLQVPHQTSIYSTPIPAIPWNDPSPVPAPQAASPLSQVQQLLQVIPDTLKGRRDLAIVLISRPHRQTQVGDHQPNRRRYRLRRLCRVLPLHRQGRSCAAAVSFLRPAPSPPYVQVTSPMSARTSPPCILRRISLAGGRRAFQGVSSATFYNRFRGYLRLAGLPPSGVHVLRHTAAKLRRDVGESVESVSQFLDHSSLAVTTTYLRRLEGQRDSAWQGVAHVLGVN